MKKKPAALDPAALTGATHDPHAVPPKYMSAEARKAVVIPLIPYGPPCFDRHASWVSYVVQAVTEVVKSPKDITPLRFVSGRAEFDRRFNFCRDCLPAHAVAMDRLGQCQPHFLKKEKVDAT